jgi:hypothetical protein
MRLLGRDESAMDETNTSVVLPPPLNAARGIVIGTVLSAVLWSLIASIIWLLAP